jgi:hypothetical protein
MQSFSCTLHNCLQIYWISFIINNTGPTWQGILTLWQIHLYPYHMLLAYSFCA